MGRHLVLECILIYSFVFFHLCLPDFLHFVIENGARHLREKKTTIENFKAEVYFEYLSQLARNMKM